jgi:hypothetical protein
VFRLLGMLSSLAPVLADARMACYRARENDDMLLMLTQALVQLLQILVMHAPLAVPLPNHTELVSRAAGPDLPPISIAAASGPAASARAAADVQHCVDALASAVTAR